MLDLGPTAAAPRGPVSVLAPASRSSAAPATSDAPSSSFADAMDAVSAPTDGTGDSKSDTAAASPSTSAPADDLGVPQQVARMTPASFFLQDAVQPGMTSGWAVGSPLADESGDEASGGDVPASDVDTASDETALTAALTASAVAPATPKPEAVPAPQAPTGGDAAVPSAATSIAALPTAPQHVSDEAAVLPKTSPNAATQSAGTDTPVAATEAPLGAPTETRGAARQDRASFTASAMVAAETALPAAMQVQAQAQGQAPELTPAETTAEAARLATQTATPAGAVLAALVNEEAAAQASSRDAGSAAVPNEKATAQARPSLRSLFLGERSQPASGDAPRSSAVTDAAPKPVTAARDGSVTFGFEGAFSAPKAATPPVVTTSTFATTLASTSAAQELGGALPADTARQIVQAIRMQWANGTSEARIVLQPDQFGAMTVNLRVERGQVIARVEADAPVVREWLQSNQATLRQSLADQHLTLSRLEVAEPRDAQDAERRGGGQGAPQQHQPQKRHRPATPDTEFEVLA